MAEEIDVKTFNLADVLAGRTFPTTTVKVSFDEERMFQLSKLERGLAADPSNEELEALREKFMEEFKPLFYTVHLKGVDRDTRRDVLNAVLADFPEETDFLGRPKPNPEGDEAYANKSWALFIEKLERPDGAVTTFTEVEAKLFRGRAPDVAINAVEAAIRELSEGAKSGFESAVQDLDF
jgi:hypothetical protein